MFISKYEIYQDTVIAVLILPCHS